MHRLFCTTSLLTGHWEGSYFATTSIFTTRIIPRAIWYRRATSARMATTLRSFSFLFLSSAFAPTLRFHLISLWSKSSLVRCHSTRTFSLTRNIISRIRIWVGSLGSDGNRSFISCTTGMPTVTLQFLIFSGTDCSAHLGDLIDELRGAHRAQRGVAVIDGRVR